MAEIERIGVDDARRKVQAQTALLVCAYADEDKFNNARLAGAIPLAALEARVATLARERSWSSTAGDRTKPRLPGWQPSTKRAGLPTQRRSREGWRPGEPQGTLSARRAKAHRRPWFSAVLSPSCPEPHYPLVSRYFSGGTRCTPESSEGTEIVDFPVHGRSPTSAPVVRSAMQSPEAYAWHTSSPLGDPLRRRVRLLLRLGHLRHPA